MTIQLNLGYSVTSVAAITNQFINFCRQIVEVESITYIQVHNCAKVDKRNRENRFSRESLEQDLGLGTRKNLAFIYRNFANKQSL